MVRVKKRYLVVQIQFENANSRYAQEDIYYAIKDSINKLYGDFGSAAYTSNLVVKYLNPHTSIFFLQCLRDHYKHVRTAMTFVTVVAKNRCALTCLKVTATMKLAERFLLEFNVKAMNVLYGRCRTLGEKKQMLFYMEEFDIPTKKYTEELQTDVDVGGGG